MRTVLILKYLYTGCLLKNGNKTTLKLVKKFQNNTRSDIKIQNIGSIESIESIENTESIESIESMNLYKGRINYYLVKYYIYPGNKQIYNVTSNVEARDPVGSNNSLRRFCEKSRAVNEPLQCQSGE